MGSTATASDTDSLGVGRVVPDVVREASDQLLREVQPGSTSVLVARLLRAVSDVVSGLQGSSLEEILAASSDREVLIRSLEASPSSEPTPQELHARLLFNRARLRGIRTRDRILESEGGLTGR